MKTNGLLLDADVLIEYLRGREQAISYIEGLDERLAVSVITIAELRAGLRGQREEQALEIFLEAFEPLSVDAEIARLGGDLRRRYGPSHNTGLADALIAATARSHGLTLVTFNVKHFPMLEKLESPYQRDSPERP